MIEFGEMSRDIKEMKISSKKVVIPEKKTEVLRLEHMSQHRAQHVSPHHSSNKKQPLKYHHCVNLDIYVLIIMSC